MNLKVHRIFHPKLIKRALTHPLVSDYQFSCAEDVEKFEPIINENIYYIGTWVNRKYSGMFIFLPHNDTMVEAHACIFKRGIADKLADMSYQWLWDNTNYNYSYGHIAETNKNAINFVNRIGMKYQGRHPRATRKNDKIVDVLIYGINRPN